jgi:hypothetical protein
MSVTPKVELEAYADASFIIQFPDTYSEELIGEKKLVCSSTPRT